MIRIGSLFSGIGGLELGVEVALAEAGLAPRVIWQVEQDEFCRAVLAKHWPEADRTVTDVCAASALLLPRVDLLGGGPPCQDISGAGKQEGLHGERSGLLFRYLQIVGALRPGIVVAENVRTGRWREWLGAASCGLRALGYVVEAIEALASDVGAPHRRARIFVVAYAHGGELREQPWWLGRADGTAPSSDGRSGEAMANPASLRRHEGQRGEREEAGRSEPGHGDEDMGNAERARREGAIGDGLRRARSKGRSAVASGWNGQSQPLLGRVPDGLPARVDLPRCWPAGRGEEQHPWEPPRTVTTRDRQRRARLKALGNAVVPAVAREVMRAALSTIPALRGAL